MITRRGLLAACLASFSAPALARAGSLMPGKGMLILPEYAGGNLLRAGWQPFEVSLVGEIVENDVRAWFGLPPMALEDEKLSALIRTTRDALRAAEKETLDEMRRRWYALYGIRG